MYSIYFGVIMTHLSTTVFLYHHHEDGRITGRNMWWIYYEYSTS